MLGCPIKLLVAGTKKRRPSSKRRAGKARGLLYEVVAQLTAAHSLVRICRRNVERRPDGFSCAGNSLSCLSSRWRFMRSLDKSLNESVNRGARQVSGRCPRLFDRIPLRLDRAAFS